MKLFHGTQTVCLTGESNISQETEDEKSAQSSEDIGLTKRSKLGQEGVLHGRLLVNLLIG